MKEHWNNKDLIEEATKDKILSKDYFKKET